jgi:hypothetical protein
MSPYLNETTPLSVVLFLSGIFMNSVTKSAIYCSCSSLGMRSINGLIAFMESDIKKHKYFSKRISYNIACLLTVPGHSNVTRGVTQCYSVCFVAENSVVKSHPVNFL